MKLLTLISCWITLLNGVSASSGSPFFRSSSYSWGASSSLGRRPVVPLATPSTSKPLSPRAQQYLAKIEMEHALMNTRVPRGGVDSDPGTSDAVVKVVGTVTSILVQCGKMVLPPAVALTKFVVDIYRALPKDAILAQVGLVYCFAGGYYPTLFSSLQAAQQCGWNVMVQAISELTEEALRVIEALDEVNTSKFGFDDKKNALRAFRQRTSIVLATVDPMKINQAASGRRLVHYLVGSFLRAGKGVRSCHYTFHDHGTCIRKSSPLHFGSSRVPVCK